jgi:protein-S-isoprenylcysteine O-methyltransferase Ste14
MKALFFTLKVLVYTILIPGSVLVLGPYLILRKSHHAVVPELSFITVVALILLLIGMAFLIRCIYEFALHGKGTLAPIDPPTILVVKGIYRYTRNPMYLAVLCVLLAEAMLFSSADLCIYFLCALLAINLFVRLYEEPHLRKQFGKTYQDYCRVVPRWWITRNPYNP